jgi:hypothetical protein
MNKTNEKMYMFPETGSVDNYEGWNYQDDEGQWGNAVDDGDAILVYWNKIEDCYEEVGEKVISLIIPDDSCVEELREFAEWIADNYYEIDIQIEPALRSYFIIDGVVLPEESYTISGQDFWTEYCSQ